ncbi:MAG: hypothetical protein ACI9H8_000379 [Lysobacterales bacterium]|jgi:hypothetical protein
MNHRHFLVLLFVAVVVATAVLVVSNNGSDPKESKGELLFSEVSARINEVNSLKVSSGENGSSSTLKKQESGWVVAELSDYPAQWTKLRALLAAIGEAKVAEIKTSKPEYYSRLGVEDPDEPGAESTLLTLGLGQEQIELIVGNQATSRGGQYVRLAGNPQSVLIDQELETSSEPTYWADSGIVDIGSAQVAGIEIVHADGDTIRARKVSADDTDFKLDNLPVNRKILSSWSVNSLANVFSQLEMDSVELDNMQTSAELVNIKLLMFSGLALEAQAFNQGKRGWIRLKASAPEMPGSSEASELEMQAASSLVIEAAKINQKVGGWIYRLPVSKFEEMTKNLEQILEPFVIEDGTES